jgi:CRISPR system Cascade subunit CasA
VKYSFNLIDQRWIPCVLPNGKTEELNLRDTLLNAHEITAIFDPSPLVTAALHRLLLAILHRNFGPASQTEWKALWQAGRFDANTLNNYFATWSHRFDLFDEEHPFYQVVKFPSANKIIAANEILTELPKQNTAAWFDHSTYEAGPLLTPAVATRAIIGIQAYKLAGTFIPPLGYTDAPIARPMSFLVIGKTLFETLLLNLVQYQGDFPIPKLRDDLPAWEQENPTTSTIPNI